MNSIQKVVYQKTLNTVDLLSKKQIKALATRLGLQPNATKQDVKNRLNATIALLK